jgi:hypothetical protein
MAACCILQATLPTRTRGGFGFWFSYPTSTGTQENQTMNMSNPNRDAAVHSSDWVNITLSGQAHAVEAMIHLLHRLNVIAASEWSPPVAMRDAPIVMRVAARGMRSQ